jgi:phenylalanyl-tRNA synthetase alpha chain
MVIMYTLTDEGRKYLENGLPEKKLVELVENGPVDIKEAQNAIENFSIALQWAKKNQWVTIKNEKLFLMKKPDEFPEQDALEKISSGKHVSEHMIEALLGRNLIEKEREDIVKRAKKFSGKEITSLNEELIKTGLWKTVKLKPYNVSASGKRVYPGKKHPYLAFLDSVKMKLIAMGFEEMSGPLIETEFWNMDALYMPQHHPARDIHDAYFVKEPQYAKALDRKILEAVRKSHEKGVAGSRGWNYQYDTKKAHRLILRTHGTVLSAKTLASNPKIPGKYFSILRCFRYDVIDSTHLPDFFQVEGIVVEHDLNIRHLAGILKVFAKEFAGTEKIKLVPGYFPFTEPSVELFAKHPHLGWIELGGAGIFRKEMTKPLGTDETVLAWGLGIDRLGMFNMNIKDIRQLFSTDLKYIREAKVVY